MSEKNKPTKYQEYLVQTERLKDGSIKILKREKTDLIVSIYPHEADVMNNGPSDEAVENEAAAISGKMYLPAKGEAEKEKEKKEDVPKTREEFLTATKNDDLRVIALNLTSDEKEIKTIALMIKKELIAFVLGKEAKQTDPA